MADNLSQIVALLSSMAVFKGLKPSQLEELAAMFESVSLPAGRVVFKQGDVSDSLYIVFSGRLRLTRGQDKSARRIATFVRGDILGEEGLMAGKTRTATAETIEPTVLLRLGKEAFERLLRRFPTVKPYLQATVECRRLARGKQFDWLASEETIYLMARRHPAYLYLSFVKPILLSWLALPFFYLALVTEWASIQAFANTAGMIFLVLAVLWAVWEYVDWGNDFYIVTDQRVVWIEKVIGLYDSRQQAPLPTVTSVGVQNDFWGRTFGYGDVLVRTFTGQIVMRHVGMPQQLAGLIDEQCARGKQLARKSEMEALERVIRQRLGLPAKEPPKVETPPPPPKPPKKPSFLDDLFKVRFEQSGIITFRKHWILLLQRTWKPNILLVLLVLLLLGRLLRWYTFIPLAPLWLAAALFLLIGFVWWLYEYVDWRNDIYQLTADQILDIEKKPLGPMDKKTAQLENILSLEHYRPGLIGMLLNYGDVVAMVGGVKFTFDGVYDPASVEQEIFERIAAKKRRLAEADAARERERMADWLAAYHRATEETRRLANPPQDEQKS